MRFAELHRDRGRPHLLGVGLTEPTPSWGLAIAAASTHYRTDPLYLWLPVVAITVLVLALSLLGDSVRDAFDPGARRDR